MAISSLGLCTCLLPAMSRALQAFQTRSEANDFLWFAPRGLGIIHFGPCAKWPSAGSWSFSDSSLHGCQGENFHEGPKTLEGSLLQTSPINKVRVLTVKLFHLCKIWPNYYFFCQGMERHQVQIKWKPAEVFVPYVRMPTRYHIEIITW